MHLFSMINNAYLFASFQRVNFLVNFLISTASKGHTSRNCLPITGRFHNLTFVLSPYQFSGQIDWHAPKSIHQARCVSGSGGSRTLAPVLPLRALEIIVVRKPIFTPPGNQFFSGLHHAILLAMLFFRTK